MVVVENDALVFGGGGGRGGVESDKRVVRGRLWKEGCGRRVVGVGGWLLIVMGGRCK